MRRSLARVLAGALLAAALPALHAQQAGAAVALGGTFHALAPSRILDTRSGSPLGPGTTLNVPIAGQGGVPLTSVSAVVLNVTATNTTAPGFLTVFPAGVALPAASNLNWVAGQTIAKLVTVGLGSGAVTAYNPRGSADVIFDVAGYYSTPDVSPGPDGLFNPLVPARLLDTRTGTGAPAAKMSAGQTLDLQVTGQGGVPASGVSAVVLNVTATSPTAAGFLTVFPTGVARPNVSNLNFNPAETIPNRVMVGVGTGGKVSIFSPAGSTDVIADVNGWFTDITPGGTGSWFTPLTPARILDSRLGTGGVSLPWGPNAGRAVGVAGLGGVPAMSDPNPPTAVVANVTVTNTTTAGALTAWPDTAAKPATSDVNWPQGGTVPNPTIVQVGPTGSVDIGSGKGCTDVIMDVVGWFAGPTSTIAAAPPPVDSVCPAPPWLARLNYWRSTAGLPKVTENAVWSSGDYLHSKWMVKNNLASHDEAPGSPYYTTAGDLAGNSGNIAVSSTTSGPDTWAIDWWMAAPFHAMAMMDPRWTSTGFGAYRETRSGWNAGFTLDTSRGNPFSGGTYPVFWPGNGKTVPLTTYSGNEFPDPLPQCGYSGTVGLPVFVEVGGNVNTTAAAGSTFTGNGTPLAHCVIDSRNAAVGSYLKWRGGVIIIPKAPLKSGVTYVVTVTVNSVLRTWSFSVS
ncbi:MAG: CAP domain-containing protein [Candidatus Dormiibacterota bacterium]